MNNRLGIMQGRLSPVIDGEIQAFPSRTWREEFPLAKKIGFELIEWVLDINSLSENPILNRTGRKEISALQADFGILVSSICCDYFMVNAFNSSEPTIRMQAKNMLLELINVCPEVGIKYIELPLVGKAEISNESDSLLIRDLLIDLLPLLDKMGVFILLELNLNPSQVNHFLTTINSNRILVNYDTGNSAYWGFEPNEEIPLYGKFIENVHIKDCTPRDYTVPLGEGNVDFQGVFKLLKNVGYQGDFILQTARSENHYLTAKNFYQFTKTLIDRYFNGSQS